MNDLESLDVAAIKARANVATPGPWITDPREPAVVLLSDNLLLRDNGVATCWKDAKRVRDGASWKVGQPEPFADAVFISHAREDVPALCALANELRAQLFDDDVREAMSQVGATTVPDLVRGFIGAVDSYIRREERERWRAEKAEAELAEAKAALERIREADGSDGR